MTSKEILELTECGEMERLLLVEETDWMDLRDRQLRVKKAALQTSAMITGNLRAAGIRHCLVLMDDATGQVIFVSDAGSSVEERDRLSRTLARASRDVKDGKNLNHH